ncbi:hypothetical protein BDN72DRAFT_854008 [Pluteus cervinus]|uniref:Uncharacterized protein n=1 Tax=Pluteus cervinus TaxID=181527 RepID=A0ACD3BAP0_9AGAR|nr:hypothetical protein BDN72DRAFT_854008 [Pluteus cervinus]
MRLFVSSLALTAASITLAQSLNFHLTSGANDNHFYRDEVTSAQVLLTSANVPTNLRRFVAALPAGNSGALTHFLPLNSTSPLTVTLVNGSLISTVDEFNNAGIQADLAFTNSATLGVTIIGAVRAMRDYVEGDGTMHQIFNYTLASFNATTIRFHRQNINLTMTASGNEAYKTADLYLSIPESSTAQLSVRPAESVISPPTVSILIPEDATNSILRLRFVTNETSPLGLDPADVFQSPTTARNAQLRQVLQGLADGSKLAAQQVSFLTFENKFTAGGWRFLTYFGRDSLIALRLLMPLLTQDANENALGAVIERANSTGALCHEETIGDYASFVNLQNGRGDLGNTPFYDYKMIDTDLLLLPALSHYFLDLPAGKNRAPQFLSRHTVLQNGTYAGILNRIANYNFARAVPFFINPAVSNLLAFRAGEPVGNWRDSNQGTGYGPIPFDVNTALVPASLRATQALIDAGILKPLSPLVIDGRVVNATAGDVAAVWEEKSISFFEVNVDRLTAERRLATFVEATGLSEQILRQSPTVHDRASFYALSLMPNGSPVQVLHSDLGFNLLYGNNVQKTFLQHAIDALTPYPRGLLTNVGMVVANPAYDSNRTNTGLLDRTAYHGTVIWSFQQALMAAGLSRQLNFCTPNNPPTVDENPPPVTRPTWCSDVEFMRQLRDAQTRLWASIEGAIGEIHTEVWSWSFDNGTNAFAVADLASLSGGTESDAIQLWSYGFLGLLNPGS